MSVKLIPSRGLSYYSTISRNFQFIIIGLCAGKNVEPNRMFLADDKMTNNNIIWICIHSLLKISQNIISNPHLTTLSSLSVSSVIF